MKPAPGQLGLFGEPQTAREQYDQDMSRVKLNSTVEEQDAPRLRKSLQKILDRLIKGPATNAELAEIAGHRFGSRIGELREAGHKIPEPVRLKEGNGLFEYKLIEG